MIDYKTIILEMIKDNPGIKATEMATDLAIKTFDKLDRYQKDTIFLDIDEIIRKLIYDGEIIEIEYVLKSLDYRIKSLYFPKGTSHEVISKRIEEIKTQQGDLDLCQPPAKSAEKR